MGDSETPAIDILNTIKVCNNDKDQQKWASEATSQFFEREIEKQNIKIEYLKKEEARLDEEDKRITTRIEMLEQHYKTLLETIRVCRQSFLNQTMYLKFLEETGKKNDKMADDILNDHRDQLNKYKAFLEAENPKFKILNEKKSELKRIQFDVKMLQYQLKRNEAIEQQKLSIRRQIYYNDFVNLAKAWLEKRKHDELLEKLEKVKAEEALLIKTYMDLQNQKQKHENYQQKNKGKELNVSQSAEANKTVMGPPPNKVFEYDLTKSSAQPASQTLKSLHNSTYLSNNQHTSIPSKVKILENRIIKPISQTDTHLLEQKFQDLMKSCEQSTSQTKPSIPQRFIAADEEIPVVETVKEIDRPSVGMTIEEKCSILDKAFHSLMRKYSSASQNDPAKENISKEEEKSKTLEMKLQEVVKSFKGDHAGTKEKAKGVQEKGDLSVKPLPASSKVTEPNSSETPPNPPVIHESDIENLMSQESGKNVQAKLAEFQHEPENSLLDKLKIDTQKNVPKTIQTNKNVDQVQMQQSIFMTQTSEPIQFKNVSQYINEMSEVDVNKEDFVSKSQNISSQTSTEKGNDSILNSQQSFSGFTADMNSIYGTPGEYNNFDIALSPPMYEHHLATTLGENRGGEQAQAQSLGDTALPFDGMSFQFNFKM